MGKVDFSDSELVSAVKEDLDWTQVQFKEAKRSNKFRVDAVDWMKLMHLKMPKVFIEILNPSTLMMRMEKLY